ncbi:unnamed protein product, partial [Iphiclides podalirius]
MTFRVCYFGTSSLIANGRGGRRADCFVNKFVSAPFGITYDSAESEHSTNSQLREPSKLLLYSVQARVPVPRCALVHETIDSFKTVEAK